MGFIVYDETRYYNRTEYLIGVKSSIANVISHSYSKIKLDSHDSLPLEKAMAFHTVIILIK